MTISLVCVHENRECQSVCLYIKIDGWMVCCFRNNNRVTISYREGVDKVQFEPPSSPLDNRQWLYTRHAAYRLHSFITGSEWWLAWGGCNTNTGTCRPCSNRPESCSTFIARSFHWTLIKLKKCCEVTIYQKRRALELVFLTHLYIPTR